MNKPLITVVIPVYNVEHYLKKCLDSIVNQKYSNLEIIIVNDGSTDNSEKICQEYLHSDKRINLITQKNQGLSAARNTGIDNAHGKYICFVDSDDYLDKHFVSELYHTLVKNKSDISVCDFWYVDGNGGKWSVRDKQNKNYSNIDAIKDIFSGKQETEIMTWNKLYKKELFDKNKIHFPVGKIHEDNFTTYKLYYYANSISLIDKKLYYYLQRSNSIMGEKFNNKRLDILAAIKEITTFFQNKAEEMKLDINCYEIKVKISLYNNMLKSDYAGVEKQQLFNDLKQNFFKYINNKLLDSKFKFMLIAIIMFPKLYKIIIKRK